MNLIYKILTAEEWRTAVANGSFSGSAVDLRDGYIHFSDNSQVRETAARYFAGQQGLVLAAFDSAQFGTVLKWEESRGGALFPHLYGSLDPRLVRSVVDLQWDGLAHVFPTGWQA